MNLSPLLPDRVRRARRRCRAHAAGAGRAVRRAGRASLRSLQNGGKILFFGNGGSAGDAQHLATELTVRFKSDRKAIAAIALGADVCALTAIGNDLGFDRCSRGRSRRWGRPATSPWHHHLGRERERPAALRAARRGRLVGRSRRQGRRGLVGVADPLLVVPSDTTARIQEMHLPVGQMLCEAIEAGLGNTEAPPHGR